MEENKVWRVTLKYGYYDICFDFTDADDACNFIITTGKSFNKDISYDKKDLYINMSYVDKDEKVEDE